MINVSTLQKNLRGPLIQPGDADYDTARALYNGMIDKRPRLIARCVDVADVIAAVNFAPRRRTAASPFAAAATTGPVWVRATTAW